MLFDESETDPFTFKSVKFNWIKIGNSLLPDGLGGSFLDFPKNRENAILQSLLSLGRTLSLWNGANQSNYQSEELQKKQKTQKIKPTRGQIYQIHLVKLTLWKFSCFFIFLKKKLTPIFVGKRVLSIWILCVSSYI